MSFHHVTLHVHARDGMWRAVCAVWHAILVATWKCWVPQDWFGGHALPSSHVPHVQFWYLTPQQAICEAQQHPLHFYGYVPQKGWHTDEFGGFLLACIGEFWHRVHLNKEYCSEYHFVSKWDGIAITHLICAPIRSANGNTTFLQIIIEMHWAFTQSMVG